jgi:hypothetical protein
MALDCTMLRTRDLTPAELGDYSDMRADVGA